ncbi:DUF475 domain-containing protein [Streptomyces sp. NPDC003832]
MRYAAKRSKTPTPKSRHGCDASSCPPGEGSCRHDGRPDAGAHQLIVVLGAGRVPQWAQATASGDGPGSRSGPERPPQRRPRHLPGHDAPYAIGALAAILPITIQHRISELITGLTGVALITASLLASVRRNKALEASRAAGPQQTERRMWRRGRASRRGAGSWRGEGAALVPCGETRSNSGQKWSTP